MDFYFMFCIIIQYYFVYLVAQIVSPLAFGSSLSSSHVRSLTYPHYHVCAFLFVLLFEHFLISQWYKMFQAHLICCVSCPSPEISHFSKEPWLVLENDIRNLSIGCASDSWGFFVSGPSQLTEQGNICVYTDPCVYTFLQILLYVTICINVKPRMSSCRFLRL